MPSALRNLGLLEEHDRELVAAEPRDRHGLAERHPQPVGDALEEQVAGVMAERIVDVLEVVEIEKERERGSSSSACPCERPLDEALQGGAVEEPREAIMRGGVAQPRLGGLLVRDVGGDADGARAGRRRLR